MSIFLDLLRFLAAIIVVIGHFTQFPFSTVWPDSTPWSIVSVSAFFVLSGFVIAHVVAVKEHTPRAYAIARISRLYSVLVPAVILSVVALVVAQHFDPVYVSFWTSTKTNFAPLQAHHPILRSFALSVSSLTFLNSIHNHEASPILNNPVWSLGFEAPYYALFGIFVFYRGRLRVFLVLAWCALFGIGILRLLPVWLAGVGLYEVTKKMKTAGSIRYVWGTISLFLFIAGGIVWPSYNSWVFKPHGTIVYSILHGTFRASNAYLFYYWGIMCFLLLLAVSAFDEALIKPLEAMEVPIRWCAQHTFSLYLFHFPLFVLVYAVTHYNRASVTADCTVFTGVVLACLLLSSVTESKKLWWRDIVRKAFDRIVKEPTSATRS